jgi:hypothetical protein
MNVKKRILGNEMEVKFYIIDLRQQGYSTGTFRVGWS